MSTLSPLSGGFTNISHDSAHAFRSIMTAFAKPGKIQELTQADGLPQLSPSAASAMLTLVDITTQLYVAKSHHDPEILQFLAFHASPQLTQDKAKAAFALGTWQSLEGFGGFAIGSDEYPDQSTTLIVELDGWQKPNARLSGPGIMAQTSVFLPDPHGFKTNNALYPLGCDVLLCCGTEIMGVPRSSQVEVL